MEKIPPFSTKPIKIFLQPDQTFPPTFPSNLSTNFFHLICPPTFPPNRPKLSTNRRSFSTNFSTKLIKIFHQTEQAFQPTFPPTFSTKFFHQNFPPTFSPNRSKCSIKPNKLFHQLSTDFFHRFFPPVIPHIGAASVKHVPSNKKPISTPLSLCFHAIVLEALHPNNIQNTRCFPIQRPIQFRAARAREPRREAPVNL